MLVRLKAVLRTCGGEGFFEGEGASWRLRPAMTMGLSLRMSPASLTPPEAMTGVLTASTRAAVRSMFGPVSMPSFAMSV
jgi:hypothetical protein